MKVADLQQLLKEQPPGAEVEFLYKHQSGEMFMDLSEVHTGTFTRISECMPSGERYQTPLVERSQPTCRIILES